PVGDQVAAGKAAPPERRIERIAEHVAKLNGAVGAFGRGRFLGHACLGLADRVLSSIIMAHDAPAQHLHQPIDAAAVLAWYDRHARILRWRVSPADRARGVRPDPYHVWLSEIMLQQTTIAAVGKYFAAFTTLWPTVEALARAPLDDVLVQ